MPPRPPRPALAAPPPTIFAHRGGATLWPENTLLAFEHSIAMGIDFLETDIHLTRDGELVLCHDPTVDRTTDGHGAIAELALRDLRRLDAGWRYSRDGTTFPFRGRGIGIPTLGEALALDPRVRFNLDVKPEDPAVIGRLIDALELGGYGDRVVVASHSQSVIERFRSGCRGRIATAAGPLEVATFFAGTQLGLTHRLHPSYDALQVPLRRALLRVVDGPFVEAAHALGLPVHVFTIDAPATMRELLHLGVDGLMTNRPDRLTALARDLATTTGPVSER